MPMSSVPIPQHDRFVTTGRWATRMVRPFARLDLPDSMDGYGDGPFLLAGNHRSFFDVFATLAVFAKFNLSSHILIRADLVDSGVSGRVLRGLGSIATNREKRQEAEDEAVRALEAGHAVSLMPEGRLVKPEDRAETGVGPGRPGLSRIARRVGADVIPVAFAGTDDVWPRGSFPRPRLSPPTVKLRLGEPVPMGSDDDQANVDAFMGRLAELVRQTEQSLRIA